MTSGNDKIKRLALNLKKNPGDSFSKFALALELLKRNEVSKAKVLFESVLEQDPGYLGVYYHLGKLYQQLELYERAETLFLDGIQLAGKQNDSRTKSELTEALETLKNDTDYEG
jgi:Tfp pilus assembly protein PilF